jgi:hypothetical protein
MGSKREEFIIRIVEERDEFKKRYEELFRRNKLMLEDITSLCKELNTTYSAWLGQRANKSMWDAVVPIKIEKEEQENV